MRPSSFATAFTSPLVFVALLVIPAAANAQYLTWAYLSNKPPQPLPGFMNGTLAFKQRMQVVATISVYTFAGPDDTLTMRTTWYFPSGPTTRTGTRIGPGLYQVTHPDIGAGMSDPTLVALQVDMLTPAGSLAVRRFTNFVRVP